MKELINFNELKEKDITILGHKDADFDTMTSGILLSYIFNKLGIKNKFIIPDGKIDPYFSEIATGLNMKYTTKKSIDKNSYLFLVDHTDKYEQEIIGCIDHHPEIVKINKNYINIPKTSCAKIIYELAEELELEIPDNLKILVVYSCYMDSLSFKSSKTLPEDRIWCENQIKKLNLKKEEIENFGYGITDTKLVYEDYIRTGLKTYPYKNIFIKSSYIVNKGEEVNFDVIANELKKELDHEIIEWTFIVFDVYNERTSILIITKDYHLLTQINKLLSRGKDIIPAVMNFLDYQNNGDITKMLINDKKEIATMESCTSGLIASNITDYEGASNILKGSLITYSNEAKIMQGVSKDIINDFGVYSKQTAIEMAWNTKNKFHSNIGIGITGSFSNVDPANKDSVAGEVYFNILTSEISSTTKLTYHNLDVGRKEIKQKTVDIVLKVLYSILKNNTKNR